jgi:alanine racemase
MRHTSYLEVNLALLGENVEQVKKMVRSEILPMVKADAYGNGLLPVSQFLVNECGIKKLGCASLGEALRLLEECPTLNAEILVFSDTEISHPQYSKAYENLPITPVLHQKRDVEVFLGNSGLKDLPVVLKVNTGMNRLGLSLNELEELAPKLKSRGVKHLMTHFACSYYPLKAGDKTHRQMDEFTLAQKILRDAGVEVQQTSVANSGAIEQGFGIDETYVRPGLMLYGPSSLESGTWHGHQISRFITKVLKTFIVKKGTPVGYGINVAGEDGLIAVLPLGYGDGLPTYAAGVKVKVNGFEGKFFARTNMDMSFLMFDLSAREHIKQDDVVEIWNNNNQVIADLANQMKTIPYQLMCGISGRIPKIYKVK